MESYQEQVLAFLKGEMNAAEKKAFEDSLARSGELRAELERSRELLELMEAANEQATTRRVDQQIRQSIERGASDIHLIPGLQETSVHFRHDGVLQEMERLPRDVAQAVVDRWKLLSDCSLTERQLPQEGRILITHEGRDYDLRVTFLPTVLGERVTARIIFKSGEIVEMDRLWLPEPMLSRLKQLAQQPNGLLVVSGRHGSGKTTTLYAILLEIQKAVGRKANIMTVEEPVEFVLDGLSQVRVNRRDGLTYAAALRAVLRSDLDVVMIGDLPDHEVTELALQMAMTGHLVLAPVNANHSLDALQRLRDLGADPYLLAQTLIGVTAQRLLRRVCTYCVAEYEPKPAALQRLGLTAADSPFRHGTGCEQCRNSGYKGRAALYELADIDPELGQQIAAGGPVEAAWQQALARHGGSLRDAARTMVREGTTTAEEALRVLSDYSPPSS